MNEDLLKLATWRAAYWAKKQTYINIEDLLSITYIAITRAMKKYDKHRGTKLTTYLVFCIDNAVKTELKRESTQHKIKQKAIDTYKELYNNNDDINRVKEAIKELEEDERELIEQYFYKKLTLREIATQYNTYEVNIYRRIEKIKEKLKEILL